MQRKSANPKAAQDDPKQSARFIETAKEIEADERPEAFDKAFTRVARLKAQSKGPQT